MVNNTNHRLLVSGACNTVINASGRVKITNGPVYDLVLVKALLKKYGLRVINEQAQADQITEFNPELDDDELVAFICEVVPNDREDSERCNTSVGMQIDCDSYGMCWNRNRRVRWQHGAKIYVKFGFAENNNRCLVVSIHRAIF